LVCSRKVKSLNALRANWPYFHHRQGKIVRRTPVAMPSKVVGMSRRSPTGTVVSVNTPPVKHSPHLSMSFPTTSGATLASCVSFAAYNMRLADIYLYFAGIFIFFNFAVVFICTGLYLGGLRKIKDSFKPSVRKSKKEQKKRQSGDKA
jgi:hypothetical protein